MPELVTSVADAAWKIASVGDYNGDGKADLLWRNSVSGDNIIWFMNGTTLASYSRITNEPDLNWKIGIGQ